MARPQQKALMVQHLRESGAVRAGFSDFSEMLPGLTRGQLQTMLNELRKEKRIHLVGARHFARWYAGSGPDGEEPDQHTLVEPNES